MQGHKGSILPQRNGVTPVDNNTVAYFPFDEHARDVISGKSPIGEQNALSFDGASTYVSIPHDSVFTINAVTIELWLKWNGSGTTVQFLTAKAFEQFEIHTGGGGGSNGLRFIPVNGVRLDTGDNAITPGKFHHVACVYDPINNTGKIYVDGIDANAIHSGSALTTPLKNDTTDIFLGRRSNSSYFLNGVLSNVRIHNKALSAEEIKKSMNNTIDANNTIGYWKLNENKGSIVYDASRSGNDGIITNGDWIEGPAVYSLVKDSFSGGTIQAQETKSYGKGILVEESTTNLWLNPYDATTWNQVSATVIKDGGGLSPDNSPTDRINYTGTTTNWDIVYQGSMTAYSQVKFTGTYTWSAWLKTSDGSSKTIYVTWGSPDALKRVQLNIDGTWKRYTALVTPNNENVHLGNHNTLTPAGWSAFSVDIYKPQLEQKTYATSFVDGSRQRGELLYFTNLDGLTGTLSFWCNVKKIRGSWQHLVTIGKAKNDASNYVSILFNNSTKNIGLDVKNGTTVNIIDSGYAPLEGEWHHYAATWDNGTAKIYIDGSLKGTGTYINNRELNYIYSGGFLGNIDGTAAEVTNGIIDELRIDNVARSEAEIRSWYYQGRNGWE